MTQPNRRSFSKTLAGGACLALSASRILGANDKVRVGIIGCGGITTGEDAVEMMMAGAIAVQVGTATFLNPRAPLDVLEGLETWLTEHGASSAGDIVGAAVPGRRAADSADAERITPERVHPGG